MQTTDVEKMTVSVKTAIGLLLAVASGVAGGVVNQVRLGAKVDSVQEKLVTLQQDVRAFSKVNDLQTKIESLQLHGSDAVQKLAVEMGMIKQSVDAFRSFGSPGEVKRMDSIEVRLVDLERKVEVHEQLDRERQKALSDKLLIKP